MLEVRYKVCVHFVCSNSCLYFSCLSEIALYRSHLVVHASRAGPMFPYLWACIVTDGVCDHDDSMLLWFVPLL